MSITPVPKMITKTWTGPLVSGSNYLVIPGASSVIVNALDDTSSSAVSFASGGLNAALGTVRAGIVNNSAAGANFQSYGDINLNFGYLIDKTVPASPVEVMKTGVKVGTIYGGAVVASNASGTLATQYAYTDGTETVLAGAEVDDVTINAYGLTATNVYGGGAGYGSFVNGDVTMEFEDTVSVTNVYGGGYKGAVVLGNVNISVISSGGYTNVFGSIYGGGYQASVDGDVNITISGSSQLTASLISGAGNGAGAFVAGTSTLTFDNFTAGKFTGTIKSFDVVEFEGSTTVTLSKAQDASMLGATYKFNVNSDSLLSAAPMLTVTGATTFNQVTITIAGGEESLANGGSVILFASKLNSSVTEFYDSLNVVNESGLSISGILYDITKTTSTVYGSVITLDYNGTYVTIDQSYTNQLVLSDADETVDVISVDAAVTKITNGINAGGGDDIVNIQGGAEVYGTINLGSGSNELNIFDEGILNGAVVFEAGSLSNEFNVIGQFDGTIRAEGNTALAPQVNEINIFSVLGAPANADMLFLKGAETSNNIVTLYGGSEVGTIYLNGGDNELEVKEGATIDGYIYMGNGDSRLTLWGDGGVPAYTVDMGSGENEITLNAGVGEAATDFAGDFYNVGTMTIAQEVTLSGDSYGITALNVYGTSGGALNFSQTHLETITVTVGSTGIINGDLDFGRADVDVVIEQGGQVNGNIAFDSTFIATGTMNGTITAGTHATAITLDNLAGTASVVLTAAPGIAMSVASASTVDSIEFGTTGSISFATQGTTLTTANGIEFVTTLTLTGTGTGNTVVSDIEGTGAGSALNLSNVTVDGDVILAGCAVTVTTSSTVTGSIEFDDTIPGGAASLSIAGGSTLTADVGFDNALNVTITGTGIGTLAGNITGNAAVAHTLTFVASANTAAINGDVTMNDAADTINVNSNTTISGTLALGAGADAITVAATKTLTSNTTFAGDLDVSGAVTGNITGGALAQTLDFTGASTILGTVDMAAGDDTVIVTGATTATTVALGAGSDTLTATAELTSAVTFAGDLDISGAVTGNITGGAANQTLEFAAASTIVGTVDMAAGDDTVIVTGATTATTVALGAGTDTLTATAALTSNVTFAGDLTASGMIVGNITALAEGQDLTFDAVTNVDGNVTMTAGADIVNVDANTDIGGDLNLGLGAGDALNIDAAAALVVGGTLSVDSLANIDYNGTGSVDAGTLAITGAGGVAAAALNAATGVTFDDLNVTGLFNVDISYNHGLMDIAAGNATVTTGVELTANDVVVTGTLRLVDGLGQLTVNSADAGTLEFGSGVVSSDLNDATEVTFDNLNVGGTFTVDENFGVGTMDINADSATLTATLTAADVAVAGTLTVDALTQLVVTTADAGTLAFTGAATASVITDATNVTFDDLEVGGAFSVDENFGAGTMDISAASATVATGATLTAADVVVTNTLTVDALTQLVVTTADAGTLAFTGAATASVITDAVNVTFTNLTVGGAFTVDEAFGGAGMDITAASATVAADMLLTADALTISGTLSVDDIADVDAASATIGTLAITGAGPTTASAVTASNLTPTAALNVTNAFNVNAAFGADTLDITAASSTVTADMLLTADALTISGTLSVDDIADVDAASATIGTLAITGAGPTTASAVTASNLTPTAALNVTNAFNVNANFGAGTLDITAGSSTVATGATLTAADVVVTNTLTIDTLTQLVVTTADAGTLAFTGAATASVINDATNVTFDDLEVGGLFTSDEDFGTAAMDISANSLTLTAGTLTADDLSVTTDLDVLTDIVGTLAVDTLTVGGTLSIVTVGNIAGVTTMTTADTLEVTGAGPVTTSSIGDATRLTFTNLIVANELEVDETFGAGTMDIEAGTLSVAVATTLTADDLIVTGNLAWDADILGAIAVDTLTVDGILSVGDVTDIAGIATSLDAGTLSVTGAGVAASNLPPAMTFDVLSVTNFFDVDVDFTRALVDVNAGSLTVDTGVTLTANDVVVANTLTIDTLTQLVVNSADAGTLAIVGIGGVSSTDLNDAMDAGLDFDTLNVTNAFTVDEAFGAADMDIEVGTLTTTAALDADNLTVTGDLDVDTDIGAALAVTSLDVEGILTMNTVADIVGVDATTAATLEIDGAGTTTAADILAATTLSFDNLIVTDTLEVGESLAVTGNVDANVLSVTAGTLEATDLSVGTDFDVDVDLAGSLDVDNLNVAGILTMDAAADVAGVATMTTAATLRINGAAAADVINAATKLTFTNLTVDGAFTVNEAFTAVGTIAALNATVGEDVALSANVLNVANILSVDDINDVTATGGAVGTLAITAVAGTTLASDVDDSNLTINTLLDVTGEFNVDADFTHAGLNIEAGTLTVGAFTLEADAVTAGVLTVAAGGTIDATSLTMTGGLNATDVEGTLTVDTLTVGGLLDVDADLSVGAGDISTVTLTVDAFELTADEVTVTTDLAASAVNAGVLTINSLNVGGTFTVDAAFNYGTVDVAAATVTVGAFALTAESLTAATLTLSTATSAVTVGEISTITGTLDVEAAGAELNGATFFDGFAGTLDLSAFAATTADVLTGSAVNVGMFVAGFTLTSDTETVNMASGDGGTTWTNTDGVRNYTLAFGGDNTLDYTIA